ncbi:MAG TPA: rod-binding protein [Alphaproteobacteria bacterium]|nr:rod-binding protein [Alphaproteobacteria bacterium]
MDAVQSMGDMALTQAMGSIAARAPSVGPDANTAAIDKAAQNFEGMFLSQMLEPMFETVKVDPVFGGGNGEDVMRSFLMQEYGKIIARHGGFGIASYVKAEMLRAQGRGDKAAATGKPSFRAAAAAYAGAHANLNPNATGIVQ